ncbi:MAG: molybdate ABC transporter permease subunit [Helicobacter sp.]|nr:molybdate ABC transporter permease subunit [Helicobacter sp.]
MQQEFLQTMLLTFKLSLLTTLILLPIGIMLAALLDSLRCKLVIVLESLIWMPLILPPSVLGFYLLIAFNKHNALGAFLLEHFSFQLAFNFHGLVVASVIFSLPFMVNPIKNALASLPQSLKEASYTLGKGNLYTLFFVLLPNIKGALLLGCVTSFAHTIGEFGVVMMIGGSRMGETKVASIAIYEEAESLNYGLAHQYALSLSAVSFLSLCVIFLIMRRYFDRHLRII